MDELKDDELQHYGVKGMKWGIRRSKSQLSSGSKNTKTKKQSNSAARTFYKREQTDDFSEYKKKNSALEKKEAQLTKSQIEDGRYRVARFRNVAAKTTAASVGTGMAVLSSAAGLGLLSIPVGAVAVAGANYALKGNYYSNQQKTYKKRKED